MKVLIIDDHSLIRRGLKADILDIEEDAKVYLAETFEEGISVLGSEQVDIVILDIDIPGGKGVQMIDLIRAKNRAILILVHSGYDEKEYALPFLQAGANGFLSKKASSEDFANAIQTLIANRKYISPSVQKILINTLGSGHVKHLRNPVLRLSPRELLVMKLLSEGKWNKEIALIMNLKPNTVSTYKKRLFEKLGIQDEHEIPKIMALYHN